jgi:hypothetical protein
MLFGPVRAHLFVLTGIGIAKKHAARVQMAISTKWRLIIRGVVAGGVLFVAIAATCFAQMSLDEAAQRTKEREAPTTQPTTQAGAALNGDGGISSLGSTSAPSDSQALTDSLKTFAPMLASELEAFATKTNRSAPSLKVTFTCSVISEHVTSGSSAEHPVEGVVVLLVHKSTQPRQSSLQGGGGYATEFDPFHQATGGPNDVAGNYSAFDYRILVRLYPSLGGEWSLISARQRLESKEEGSPTGAPAHAVSQQPEIDVSHGVVSDAATQANIDAEQAAAAKVQNETLAAASAQAQQAFAAAKAMAGDLKQKEREAEQQARSDAEKRPDIAGLVAEVSNARAQLDTAREQGDQQDISRCDDELIASTSKLATVENPIVGQDQRTIDAKSALKVATDALKECAKSVVAAADPGSNDPMVAEAKGIAGN